MLFQNIAETNLLLTRWPIHEFIDPKHKKIKRFFNLKLKVKTIELLYTNSTNMVKTYWSHFDLGQTPVIYWQAGWASVTLHSHFSLSTNLGALY